MSHHGIDKSKIDVEPVPTERIQLIFGHHALSKEASGYLDEQIRAVMSYLRTDPETKVHFLIENAMCTTEAAKLFEECQSANMDLAFAQLASATLTSLQCDDEISLKPDEPLLPQLTAVIGLDNLNRTATELRDQQAKDISYIAESFRKYERIRLSYPNCRFLYEHRPLGELQREGSHFDELNSVIDSLGKILKKYNEDSNSTDLGSSISRLSESFARSCLALFAKNCERESHIADIIERLSKTSNVVLQFGLAHREGVTVALERKGLKYREVSLGNPTVLTNIMKKLRSNSPEINWTQEMIGFWKESIATGHTVNT